MNTNNTTFNTLNTLNTVNTVTTNTDTNTTNHTNTTTHTLAHDICKALQSQCVLIPIDTDNAVLLFGFRKCDGRATLILIPSPEPHNRPQKPFDRLNVISQAKRAGALAGTARSVREAVTIIKQSERMSLDEIRKRYRTGADLITLAELNGLSVSHIKAILNIKPVCLAKRMEEASRKLTQTTQSVEQIAIELGYANRSNFNRAFKSHYKTTPSQYRAERTVVDDE